MPRELTNERGVKAAVRTILATGGDNVWYFMPVPGGFGKAGIPDFVGIAWGHPFVIETKFGGNKPTAQQQREMDAFRAAGGEAVFVINEDNTELIWKFLVVCRADPR